MTIIKKSETHNSSKNLNRLLLFSLFGIVLLCSCRTKKITQINPESTTWESSLNDMLPKPMIRAILTDSLEATIPFQITNSKGNKLSNITFEILRNENLVHLKTNNSGLVFLNLNYGLLSENPKIRIVTDSTLSKDVRYSVGGKTVVFRDGKSIDNDVIEFENLPFIEDRGFKLYYTISKDSATKQLPEFIESIDLIKKIMGKSKIEFISPLLVTKNNISIIGEPENIILLPVNISSWHERYWYFTHETVENDLINQKDIYSKNPNLRFVGDGLAELISFMILKTDNPEYAEKMLNNRLLSIEKSTQLEFDIYNWSIESEEIEGYSYSLAFWLKLLDNYSMEQIQDFIRLFDNSTDFSKESVHKIFDEAFGLNISFNLTKSEAIDKLTYSKK